MRKGFTLAEILITLAIIGIVAAITIPSVIIDSQKHELYTRFIKIYSDFSRILPIAINENGSVGTWNSQNCADILNYLKISKRCENTKDCFSEQYKMNPKSTTYSDNGTDSIDHYLPGNDIVELQSGAVVAIKSYTPDADTADIRCIVTVDTNGKKKPNTLGRDFFRFAFYINTNSFAPFDWPALDTNKCGAVTYNNPCISMPIEQLRQNCLNGNEGTSGGTYQSYCSYLMLREKRMKY